MVLVVLPFLVSAGSTDEYQRMLTSLNALKKKFHLSSAELRKPLGTEKIYQVRSETSKWDNIGPVALA